MKKSKKAKSKTSTGSKRVNEDSWRNAIDAVTINDKQWWCIVAMMVETKWGQSKFVSLFDESAKEGTRKAIHALNYQKVMTSIKSLSKESVENVPAVQGVCHYASKVLTETGVISTWLMARVIKFLIYRAREENIGMATRLADLERQIDEEYWIMQNVANWGQPGAKGFSAQEKLNNKANTRLRKRNEEWRDAIFINDAPIDGPNLYIIITGFYDPNLPQNLIDAGVPLTTIISIGKPRQQFRRLKKHEIGKDSAQTQESLLEMYTCTRRQLFKFWTTIQEEWMDQKTHSIFCDVAFPVFYPPSIAQTSDEDEYENQKKDVYDEVSYFLYDLYDLHRQHKNYLQSMKVENLVRDRDYTIDKTVYDSLLDKVPAERVSVILILAAMLIQVEENEKKTEEARISDLEGDGRKSMELANTDTREEVDTANPSAATIFKGKLSSLNTKFNLIEEDHAICDKEDATDIELILHGDSLNETIRLNKSANFIVRSGYLIDTLSFLWCPGIMNLHMKQAIPEILPKYFNHIDKTRHYFDVKITCEEVRHHLHILMFHRLLFDTSKSTKSRKTTEIVLNESKVTLKRSKSVPSLRSQSMQEFQFHSDGKIDYSKTATKLAECSPLFDVIDPRELLAPGYLSENIFKTKCLLGNIDEFDDVELLAGPVFLQSVYQCLLSFNRFETLYFEPTDAVLLCFVNDFRVNGVHEAEKASNIRTPVRFRDFCQYVVEEEWDWIQREEEENRLRTSESIGRLMSKVQEMYEETMLFRDEDFILPGSLKAKYLKKNLELDLQSSANGTPRSKKGSSRKKKDEAKKPKQKQETKGKKKESANSKKQLEERKGSISTLDKSSRVDDSEKAANYEFIGYDLGKLRVQVTNRMKTFFSADGTLVRVEMDDWLYGNKDLRVTVTVRGNDLRLFRRIGAEQPVADNVMFHLTNKLGIILSFEKQPQLQRNGWSGGIDFRASWPSGLTIEPISCEEPENPFYIRQSYVPKSSDANHEVCRKFLRNGTVLKYLDNGEIVVLCPNGTIVTCTAFQTLPTAEDKTSVDEANAAKNKGNRPNGEPNAPLKSIRTPSTLKLQFTKVTEEGTTSVHQASATVNPTYSTVKVLRYTVLDHDGQRYEVVNDFVVSKHHQLLVRTASDYEVDEKFTRRADGTDMVLKSNGELIVGFPDGTCIMTGYTIEKEPAMCDWTEEEIQRYFTSAWTMGEEGFATLSNLEQVDRDSLGSSAEYESEVTDIAEILKADGFISVLLTCSATHKKYATVFYDQSAVSCALSMPGDLRVSISRKGHYEVSMADGVNLKIKDDRLSLKGNACASCESQSTSTYSFFSSDSPDIVFTSVDVFGNTFEILDDGETRFRRKSQPGPCELDVEADFTENSLDEEEEQEYGSWGTLKHKHDCHHKCLHFKDSTPGYRIFSINRDLTAYEYIHRSVVNQAEAESIFDNETSVILYRSPCLPEFRRLITFQTVKPESSVKDLLAIQVPKVRPTNFYRRDLVRSTYSLPYDWKFPFGKNGDGIWETSHDLPLTSDSALVLPELLRIRILCNFKKPGGNAVIDIQRALGRYWMSLITDEPSTTANNSEENNKQKDKSVYEDLENSLPDLALGIRNTIDSVTYKLGLQKQKPPKTRAAPTSIKLEELLAQRAANQKTIEWYKRCMRERIIIPYFQNVTGTCFLVVQHCVEVAMELSRVHNLLPICNKGEYLCQKCHAAEIVSTRNSKFSLSCEYKSQFDE